MAEIVMRHSDLNQTFPWVKLLPLHHFKLHTPVSDYDAKKKKFGDMITLYGRKPVLEILIDTSIQVFRLHLADSNMKGETIGQIERLAAERNIEIVRHSKQALSRISKNARQDQGVAIDIQALRYQSVDNIDPDTSEILGLDQITNPQNLGMIIRSVAASPTHALLLPKKGCARIDPLVHKASAGTLIKSSIYHCPTLETGIKKLKSEGFEVFGLDGNADTPLSAIGSSAGTRRLFLLGNETTGLSEASLRLCDQLVSIPLRNNVESINVANAATLVAFRSTFTRPD